MADSDADQTKVFPLFLKLQQQSGKQDASKKEKSLERKRKYEKEGRKRTFQPSWLNEFQWLVFDSKSNSMRCNICSNHESFGSFVTGSNFFRKDSLKAHEDSQSHKLNVKKEKASNNPESSDALKALKQLNEKTISQLNFKFRNVHYLSKKCRPYTDYVELCNLNKAQGLDIGTTYLTKKSATEFMSFIAEAARERIRKNIQNSKFIAVISDGSTDASYQEAEIVYVRTCNKGKIQVYFSLIKNVPQGNAQTICGVMQDGLKNLAPDYSNKLVATGTDGASAMLGSKSGAVQRLREAVDRPFIVGVHCNGHKLELSFKDSIKEKILLYNKVELLLTNIYYFYRNSNVNRSGLKESSKAIGKKMVYPTRVSGTRWVGHMKIAIENFLKGYDIFVTHLGQLQNRDLAVSRSEKGNKAKGLYACAQTKSVWLMLHFLLDVLEVLSSVSRKFQSQTACVSEVLTEIEMAVACLEKLKKRDGLKLRQAMESIPDELTGDDRSFVSARQKLLAALVESLHHRFTDKPGILAAVSAFNLSLFPSDAEDLKDYGDEEVDQLVDQFGTGLTDAGVDVNQIAHEWTKLKQLMPARFTGPVNNITWADVNSRLGKVCSNILALVDLVHTIPASSADAERGFSYLKNTKSASRNKLLDINLSNQMMVVLETEAVANYDPTEAVNLWYTAAVRRPRQENFKSVPSGSKSTTGQSDKTIEQSSGIVESEGNLESPMAVSSESDNEELTTQVTTNEEHVSTTTDTSTGEQDPQERMEELSYVHSGTTETEHLENEIENKVMGKHDNNSELSETESMSDSSQKISSNSDVNNNDSEVINNEKQDKQVGSDSEIPVFSSQSTQTESSIELVIDNEIGEESYTSDCEFYDNEYDDNQFEKNIQYEDRIKLAKKAYQEFVTLMLVQ